MDVFISNEIFLKNLNNIPFTKEENQEFLYKLPKANITYYKHLEVLITVKTTYTH